MHERRKTHLSKLLSLVLRHKPEEFGLALEKGGWIRVDKLIDALALKGTEMNRRDLDEVVRSGEKRRFELNQDKSKVRATHGHSVKFEPDDEPMDPPELLFHGAVADDIESIKKGGLTSGDRMWVHLSPSRESAFEVASRRGAPIVVEIRAGEMAKQGHKFFFAASGLWLTQNVPSSFIKVP